MLIISPDNRVIIFLFSAFFFEIDRFRNTAKMYLRHPEIRGDSFLRYIFKQLRTTVFKPFVTPQSIAAHYMGF